MWRGPAARVLCAMAPSSVAAPLSVDYAAGVVAVHPAVTTILALRQRFETT